MLWYKGGVKKILLPIVFAFVLCGFAQNASPNGTSKQAVPELTDHEKLQLRNAQVELLAAEAALRDVISQLPEERARVAAQSKVTLLVQMLFAKYGADSSKFAFCDGPNPQEPLCANVAKGELVFKPRPAKEEKK